MKVVHCGNAFSDKRVNEVFINYLLTSTQSAVGMPVVPKKMRLYLRLLSMKTSYWNRPGKYQALW